MTARLLMALIQNGAAMPATATIMPPSAGPTARLTLKPTLFAATAGVNSCLGTSCGTIDCQAGAVIAATAPIRKVNSSKLPDVAAPTETIAANSADTAVTATSPMMRNLRLSTMSARAPAGTANRKIGSVVAT
jgi:hypothetical protein